jgi:hypothetical protein
MTLSLLKKPTVSFPFEYKAVARKTNPMKAQNPLKKGTGSRVSIKDRVDYLENFFKWDNQIDLWKEAGIVVDLTRMPRVAMLKLGTLLIDEDIQRGLDRTHCVNIANPETFDLALCQTLQCIKNSKDEWISIDGQHTATVIAALIKSGLAGDIDWREFEFPVQYIETDNLSFARRAFAIINGRGKKRISKYVLLRTSVYIVRIDNDLSNDEDVELERKVSICESFDCYPVEEKSTYAVLPGTFTHISEAMNLDNNVLTQACKWHNDYFHYDIINGALWFMFRDLMSQFKKTSTHLSDQLCEDLAAIVQTFGGLHKFHLDVQQSFKRWSKEKYGYESWNPFAIAACIVQIYHKLGGNEKVPKTFLDEFDGLLDYFPDYITSRFVR